ncbi:MAG: hypothetical protein HF962_07055 [Sulfurovum sp.]|nr:hypothetical protein [Sulfurovum sp.]
MKKILLGLIALIVIVAGVLFGINGTSNYDASKYSLTIAPSDKSFGIGSTIDFILPDQFDKVSKLPTTTQKLIFIFSKDTGHLMKEFMDGKTEDFLSSKNALVIADVSTAPTVIRNTFILPGLKKSSYSMVLIYDKEMAKQLKDGKDETKIIVMTLDNRRATKVTEASSVDELGKLL